MAKATDGLPVNSLDLASHVAIMCERRGFEWNNTKIQKLVYCCYGSVLAGYGVRLCDEYPRAWQYGPVFPRVFNHIQKGRTFPIENISLGISTDMDEFLGKVIDTFGKYSAGALSNWSHRKGSPWDTVINVLDAPNSFIPDDMIRDYFGTFVTPDKADAAD